MYVYLYACIFVVVVQLNTQPKSLAFDHEEYVYTYIYIYTNIYIYDICIYICICIYIYICVYTCIYTYIHVWLWRDSQTSYH